MRKIQKIEFYYARNNRLFAVLFCRKNLIVASIDFVSPTGHKICLLGKIPKTLKTKNAEFGACDFRFAPHQKKRNFFVQKKQRKIYLHCSDYVHRTPLLATGG